MSAKPTCRAKCCSSHSQSGTELKAEMPNLRQRTGKFHHFPVHKSDGNFYRAEPGRQTLESSSGKKKRPFKFTLHTEQLTGRPSQHHQMSVPEWSFISQHLTGRSASNRCHPCPAHRMHRPLPAYTLLLLSTELKCPLMNRDTSLNQNQQEEAPKSPHKVIFQANQVLALKALQELEMKISF